MTAPMPVPAGSASRTIPFDYTFRVVLDGEPDRTHQQSLAVSVEGSFTAVSIGYGVAPVQAPVSFGPTLQDVAARIGFNVNFASGNFNRPAFLPASQFSFQPTLNMIGIVDVLRSADRALATGDLLGEGEDDAARVLSLGFRLNPLFVRAALDNDGNLPLDEEALSQLFQLSAPPLVSIPFLYALFDGGTGRAFQNEPILSTAGLGSAEGERPFRRLAAPIVFEPLTTIRLEVTEIVDQRAVLFIALHGYKTLGQAGTPTGRRRRGRRP